MENNSGEWSPSSPKGDQARAKLWQIFRCGNGIAQQFHFTSPSRPCSSPVESPEVPEVATLPRSPRLENQQVQEVPLRRSLRLQEVMQRREREVTDLTLSPATPDPIKQIVEVTTIIEAIETKEGREVVVVPPRVAESLQLDTNENCILFVQLTSGNWARRGLRVPVDVAVYLQFTCSETDAAILAMEVV